MGNFLEIREKSCLLGTGEELSFGFLRKSKTNELVYFAQGIRHSPVVVVRITNLIYVVRKDSEYICMRLRDETDVRDDGHLASTSKIHGRPYTSEKHPITHLK
jgi:hypothetical protein